jgi:two-component system, NarL family, sensor kinase
MYYDGLATTYERMGDYKNANLYNQLNIRMHDALVSKENFAAAADIQNSYERAKKDNEILKLAAANKQRSTLNKILIASTLGLLLVSFLGYINFKNRNKIAKQQEQLQNQKIAELEKDKQLLAIDAMLKGQEEERSRIAKDLHDGLGGLLSGTKLSFMNIKENLVLTEENAALFDKSLSMLDNTIGFT